MSQKLANDVTLQEVINTLDNPKEYIRRVLENMQEYKKRHGDAYVQIGISGRGISPHYRIFPDPETFLLEKKAVFAKAFGNVVENKSVEEIETQDIFNGKSHKLMTKFYVNALEEHNWSTKKLHIEEVRKILGKLREEK